MGIVAQAATTQYPELVSHAILIGTTPPGEKTGVPEKLFWERSLKPVPDLDDGTVLFFEPQSESSKNAAKLSFGRIAKRTEDNRESISPPLFVYVVKQIPYGRKGNKEQEERISAFGLSPFRDSLYWLSRWPPSFHVTIFQEVLISLCLSHNTNASFLSKTKY